MYGIGIAVVWSAAVIRQENTNMTSRTRRRLTVAAGVLFAGSLTIRRRRAFRVSTSSVLIEPSATTTPVTPRRVARGVVACRLAFSRMASSAVAGGLALAGYPPSSARNQVAQQDLLKLRSARDEQSTREQVRLFERLMIRTKAEYDRYTAGETKEPPVLDLLIISGGGDWGAFGAGFLKGWQKVPARHPLAKPEFDAVTGVSTGTLIAPFAFVGDAPAIDQIVNLYRNPEADWVKQRGILYFLPGNMSFAEVPGLERAMRTHLSVDMIRRIAKAGADGRILVVTATNLDHAVSRVFDLVEEARHAVDSGRHDRIHNIVLASAGIPGAFPFRVIDQALYVDGGVTGNIFYSWRTGKRTPSQPSGSGPIRACRFPSCASG